MTLEELKDNREAIIEVIENKLGKKMVKEAMNQMVKFLGFNGIRSTNAVDYAEEVINLCDLKPAQKQLPLMYVDGVGYNDLSDYNRANNMKMYRNR